MRIVLLGPPGSGKAELSERIAKHYRLPVITVSSVMQKAAAEQSELGRLAKEAMDTARVSDELLLALLRIQMPRMDLQTGFVLVDLPRNAGQGDVLDSVLNDLGAPVQVVVNLKVDPDELMERLVGRIACDNCGAQYNLYINPPLVDGVCDECGARVIRRPDDYEETISNRLRVYEAQMIPLLQYYQGQEKLYHVEADKGAAETWPGVLKLINGLSLEESAPPPLESVEKSGSAANPPVAVAPDRKGAQRKRTAKDEEPPAGRKAATRGGSSKKAAAKGAAAKKTAATGASGKAPLQPVARSTSSGGKKSAAQKAVPKKAANKSVAVKKAAAKKKTTKKGTVGKAAVKKRRAEKTLAAKAPAGKSAVKKTTAKKSSVRKVAAKKAVVKKATVKKAAVRKAAAKRSPVGKVAAKKAVVRKAATKKSPVRKVAAKKSPAGKVAAKKAVTRKAAVKKTADSKKAVTKKVAKKRVTKRKPGARKS